MKNHKIKPTDSELKILQVLWTRGPSTVREVHEELNSTRDTGYTTTLKLMQIMADKNLVKRDTSSRTHIYEAKISQEATRGNLLNEFLESTFQGSAMSLVMQTLGNHKASKEELAQIKKLIDRLEQE